MFIGTVTGYLTGRPEVRNAGDRSIVATIRIGVKENRRRDRDEEGLFLDIEVWNDQAEYAEKYLRKGDKIAAMGDVTMDSWEDRETGERRQKLVMRGRLVEYPDKSESDRGDRDDRRDDRGRGRDRGRDRRDDRRRDDRRDDGDPGPSEPRGGSSRRDDREDDLPF